MSDPAIDPTNDTPNHPANDTPNGSANDPATDTATDAVGGVLAGLAGALQFLTRIPITLPAPVPHARIVPWFPTVGALVGAVVGGVAWGLGQVAPMPVAGVVAIVVGMLVTGAFHEDGLADIADAFGGGWTPEQRLAILKDPRHGTYGVAALASSVAIRVTAVAVLAPTTALVALVAAHVLGRAAAVATMLTAPLASDTGLGAGTAREVQRLPAAIGITAGLALVLAITMATGAPALHVAWFALAAAVAALATTVLAVRKIGGINGDVLGAVEQVAECLVLVTATILA